MQCQVCGILADPEVVQETALDPSDLWNIQRIEQKGGFVQMLTCPACSNVTHDLMLESYKERIRLGLVPGFH